MRVNSLIAALTAIGKGVAAFGAWMQIFMEVCECGSRDVKATRVYKRKWIVYCAGCHIRTSEYRWKRQAQRAWNRDMKR